MTKPSFKFKRSEDNASIEIIGRRVLVMFLGTFHELARGIEAAIGTEAAGVLYDAGIHSGRNSTRILLESWDERGEDFLKKWTAFYGSSGVGWFKIEKIDVDLAEGTGFIRLTQSFAAEEYSVSAKKRSKNPTCHILSGFFVGVFEELTGKEIECEEIKCVSTQDEYCEFRLVNY